MSYSTLMELYEPSLQAKRYFGHFGALLQRIGSFEFGQTLTVDMVNQTSRSFEIGWEDYQKLQAQFRSLSIPSGQWLYIEVKADEQDGVLDWQLAVLPYHLEYVTHLMQSCYRTDHLFELFGLIQSLDSLELQSFMWSVFDNPELAEAFVSIPASRSHHHAYPGGLLEHSLECLRIVQSALTQIPNFSKREQDLIRVAALLHDIGKTQTIKQSGEHTIEGFNLNHEHYTLSVLANELKQLKRVYEQAAVALEYMLTWKYTDGYPRFSGANLVKAADWLSTGLQLRELAFSQRPPHYHFTNLQAGNQSLYFSRIN